MSKPTFYFFKMIGCGHCVYFDEGNPSAGMQAQWPLLKNDKELQGIVKLEKYEWNPRKDANGNQLIPMLKGYRINYGPAFCLEVGKKSDGSPDYIEFQEVENGVKMWDRSAAGLKKWIMSKLEVGVKGGKMNGQAPKPAAPKLAAPKSPAGKPAGAVSKAAPATRTAPPAASPAPVQKQPTVSAVPAPQSPPQRNAQPAAQQLPTSPQATVFEYRSSPNTYSHIVDLKDDS